MSIVDDWKFFHWIKTKHYRLVRLEFFESLIYLNVFVVVLHDNCNRWLLPIERQWEKIYWRRLVTVLSMGHLWNRFGKDDFVPSRIHSPQCRTNDSDCYLMEEFFHHCKLKSMYNCIRHKLLISMIVRLIQWFDRSVSSWFSMVFQNRKSVAFYQTPASFKISSIKLTRIGLDE